MWLEATPRDAAKAASRHPSTFLPKVRTFYHLELHSGSDLFGEKSSPPYHHSAKCQGNTQSIWPESEHLDEEKRQAEPQHSAVIAGDKTGNTIWGSKQDNLDNAKAIQTGHPNGD